MRARVAKANIPRHARHATFPEQQREVPSRKWTALIRRRANMLETLPAKFPLPGGSPTSVLQAQPEELQPLLRRRAASPVARRLAWPIESAETQHTRPRSPPPAVAALPKRLLEAASTACLDFGEELLWLGRCCVRLVFPMHDCVAVPPWTVSVLYQCPACHQHRCVCGAASPLFAK